MQDNFTKTDEKWGRGFKLEEYKGVYSLTSCQETKDGNVYPEWVIPQDKDRKPRMKQGGGYAVIPIKVVLGNSAEQALQVLDVLRVMLEAECGAQQANPDQHRNRNQESGYQNQQVDPPAGGFDDDIPF